MSGRYVDYVAALDQRARQGVTPQNNASVLLWKAFGPKAIEIQPAHAKEFREQFFKMLGIPPLPEDGKYYQDFDKFLRCEEPAKPSVKAVGREVRKNA